MLSTLSFIFSLSFTFSQPLQLEQITGEYSLIIDQEFNKSLNCEFDKQLLIKNESSKVEVYGATSSPLIFENINGSPKSISGPLLGYSQYRSVITEQTKSTLILENQFRECTSLLGDLGCLGKKWTTKAWLIFDQPNDSEAYVVISYQPFVDSELESCTFIKD